MIPVFERKSKISFLYQVVPVLLFATLSVGAWWGGEKVQAERSKKETQSVTLSQVQQKDTVSSGTNRPEGINAGLQPKTIQTAVSQNNAVAKEDKKEKVVPPTLPPEKQQEEVERVQGELKEIINRTRQLQDQVKTNRSEIQQLLERAQIHERILRSITLPPPIPTKHQFDAEEIIKREKLRLIAEQTKQTQEQLRIIQQARSFNKSTSIAPSDTKTSKTS